MTAMIGAAGAYLCRSVATADVSVDDCRALEPALLHELDLAFFDDRFEGGRGAVASPQALGPALVTE